MKGTVLGAFFLAFALMIGMAPASQAAKGFYIGTGAGIVFPSADDFEFDGDGDDDIELAPDPETGWNLELIHLGYNWNDKWGLGLQLWNMMYFKDQDLEGIPDDFGMSSITVSGRYTHDTGEYPVIPYAELGIGAYSYGSEGWNIFSDDIDMSGYGGRLAVGGQYYLKNFYISPELGYHYAVMTHGTLNDYDIFVGQEDYDLDNEPAIQAITLMLKIGYHWRR